MKSHHHPPLKPPPRPLFSCAFFTHCTQSVLSPTTPQSPPPPPLPPPPPPPDSESSSSSTSQSFTQWRFPIPKSPQPDPVPIPRTHPKIDPLPFTDIVELFHIAELQFTTGSDSDRVESLRRLERSLLPNSQDAPTCPAAVMRGVAAFLKDKSGAKSATKVLLALCLGETNRHVAVETGACAAVVEALSSLDGADAERALAALELMCTVAEGAAAVRSHALAAPVLVELMVNMDGRGKECAMSVLAVMFGGGCGDDEIAPPPEEVARAVVLALQGDCSARGRRKGVQLLKALEEKERLDLMQE